MSDRAVCAVAVDDSGTRLGQGCNAAALAA
jgi:hypothetical protein